VIRLLPDPQLIIHTPFQFTGVCTRYSSYTEAYKCKHIGKVTKVVQANSSIYIWLAK